MTRPEEPRDELGPLDPEIEQALAGALRAAWSPGELSPARNDELVAMALEDPLAAATDEELIESERLRRALEGDGRHRDADLARALALATRPEAAPSGRIEPLAARALRRRPGNVVFVVFGAAAAAVALAASVLLVVRPAEQRASAAATPASAPRYEVSRSTAPLFSERFDTRQTTERIDRIASARARDLRHNRFATWGVER
jgi:hypothetical protein